MAVAPPSSEPEPPVEAEAEHGELGAQERERESSSSEVVEGSVEATLAVADDLG